MHRLAESFPLRQRCFDASELERLRATRGIPIERLAARLAAKAATLELLVGVVSWAPCSSTGGSTAAASRPCETLDAPTAQMCALMRTIIVGGSGAPRLEMRGLQSELRRAGSERVAPDPGVLAGDATTRRRAAGRGSTVAPLLLSLSHDAGLAAALVVPADAVLSPAGR